MDENYEPVLEVEDYYDGPRTGVAEFRGHLYRFRSIGWDTPDGPEGPWDPHDDRFELVPFCGEGASTPIVMRGEFRVHRGCPELPAGVIRPLEVRWSPAANT